jgi:hypothetical protein
VVCDPRVLEVLDVTGHPRHTVIDDDRGNA